MSYKVSVITPTYNAEKFLSRAIESLRRQTIGFENIQVIIVDDCSTDKTWEIVQNFTDTYANIESERLPHNSGSDGAPRNLALKLVKAKYIMFLDMDDEFTDDACRLLYDTIESADVDFAFGYFSDVDIEGNIIREGDGCYSHQFEDGKIYNFPADLHAFIPTSGFWAKIYKTALIQQKNMGFLEGIVGVDLVFFTNYLFASKCAVYVNKPVYKYTRRHGSISFTYIKRFFLGFNEAYKAYVKLLDEHGQQILFGKCADVFLSYSFRKLLKSELSKDDVDEIFEAFAWLWNVSVNIETGGLYTLAKEAIWANLPQQNFVACRIMKEIQARNKEGYISNLTPNYFNDDAQTRVIYQPNVYDLAYFIAERAECKYIIDIGSGNGLKLLKFQDKYKIIAVDFGDNENIISKNINLFEFLRADLENGLPALSDDIVSDAVIICSDVVEHIVNPDKLLRSLAALVPKCHALLFSPPERDLMRRVEDFGPPANNHHVREWNIAEFEALLRRYSFPAFMLGLTIANDKTREKRCMLALSGKIVYEKPSIHKSVLAIIKCYNEEDIIGSTIEYLLGQGVDVHIADNWSTDKSYDIAKNYADKFPTRVFLERFPAQPSEYFELEEVLKHTEAVSKSKHYDWFIHYDADEIRESPWDGVSLADAISFVDSAGYNCIDFSVLDFRPTGTENDDPSQVFHKKLPLFEFGTRPMHFVQIKAWARCNEINLSSSGGHEVVFENRKVFPLKFLLRHYPLRSQEQAAKKVFQDRKPRFEKEKKTKGWHGHYDKYNEQTASFVWDSAMLIPWRGEDSRREYFCEFISGINMKGYRRDLIRQSKVLPPINLQYYEGEDKYSDGDSEDRVLNYIYEYEPEQYSDVFEKDDDWAVFYHLTHIRKNLLNWYSFKPGSSLLEVGAGMGGLTSLFCERCAHVTAVEMSKRRATAIQARCRKYTNLEIIVGDFTRMQFNRKYDYITVIGVLEYQSVYGSGDTPQLDFLQELKKLLAPGGKLIVAIENKMGLKYWTGEVEDHSGIPFDSINDYAYLGAEKKARTFDRQELSNLLTEAGFAYNKFYYPLPDYKLPESIFTDDYLPQPNNKVFPKTTHYPSALKRNLPVVVDEERIVYTILQNRVFPFFANSFLLEGSVDSADFDKTLFALTGNRTDMYRITTHYDGERFYKSAATPEALPHIRRSFDISTELSNRGIPMIPFRYEGDVFSTLAVRHETVEERFIHLLRKRDLNGAKELLDRLYNFILCSSEKANSEDFIQGAGAGLPSEQQGLDFGVILKKAYFDLTMDNCFYADGEFLFFDQEWMANNLPASFVFYRVLRNVYVYQSNSLLEKICSIDHWKAQYGLDSMLPSFVLLESSLIKDIVVKDSAVIDKLTYVPTGVVQGNMSLLQTGHEQIANLKDSLDAVLRSKSYRVMLKLKGIAKKTGILTLLRGLFVVAKKTGALALVRALFSPRIKLFSYESSYQDNIDFSGHKANVKVIAFYLPQFHAIPENDEWWGKGFTEWTNTRKAKPRDKGHYQPRKPHADFGYYQLTDVEVLKKQVKLAKQHGVFGFCIYYYWFSGKRLLEKPLDLLLAHPEIDINYCLCWANENWTRRWDGAESEVLIKQDYSEDDPYMFIEDLQKYLADTRYIRVDGIPVILVYNPAQIPNVSDVFEKWRSHAMKIGIGKIKIWTCRTFGKTAASLDIIDRIDGEIDFPPHVSGLSSKDINLPSKTGNIFDYKNIMSVMQEQREISNVVGFSNMSPVSVFRCCMLGWDNSARRASGWTVFNNFTLKHFFEWVSSLVRDAEHTGKSFLFINAWNEWGEGTYLEPDKKYGYANINTLSRAIFGLDFSGVPRRRWKFHLNAGRL